MHEYFFAIVQCLFEMAYQMNGFHVTVLSALKVDLNDTIHLNTVRDVDKLFCVFCLSFNFMYITVYNCRTLMFLIRSYILYIL